jgi:hypothetical protein
MRKLLPSQTASLYRSIIVLRVSMPRHPTAQKHQLRICLRGFTAVAALSFAPAASSAAYAASTAFAASSEHLRDHAARNNFRNINTQL